MSFNVQIPQRITRLALAMLVVASETVKVLYIASCECIGSRQDFNGWFFPAFQQAPYTYWFHYHGLVWLSGPYSLAWWGLNSPAFLGYWVFNAYLVCLDILVVIFISRRSKLFATYYSIISVWFVGTSDPVDAFPFFFLSLGAFYWPMLALAIIVKLPVGAPLWVWQWTLNDNNSVRGPENWGRYILLASLWMISLIVYLYRRRKLIFPKPDLNG